MVSTNEAAWRRRFRAARISLPGWARDEPERLLYASNASGKWELYTWDRRSDSHRQATDRAEGTLHGELDPTGEWLWWFEDERGNEFGRWLVEPFGGGARRPAAAELPPAYSAGLELGRGFAVQGDSTDDGSRIYLLRGEAAPRLLYEHREAAWTGGLARDEALLCIGHAEHGDSRHPALRAYRSDGTPVADLWDGPGRGLWPAGWSPVAGDQRLLVIHERQDMPRPLIWTPETGNVVELVIDLPGEVGADWYPDASALLLSHDYRGRVELYRYDLAHHTLVRIPTEPGTIAGAQVRPDGEVWYAWTRSSTPPEIRATGTRRQPEPMAPTKLAGGDASPGTRRDAVRAEELTPLGGDSNDRVLLRAPGERPLGGVAYSDHEIQGVPVFLAEPETPRPHPTVFEVHGGPTAHDRDAFSPLVQAWVDHGFAVVLVNYRGSTGYGKAWRDAIERNPGLTELQDIATVHDWTLREGIADPARIVLAGGSWGGYLALLGLGTQPGRWSLGLAAVPVADYIAAYEDEMEPLRDFDRSLFGGSPEEIPDAYVERSPITYAERVRAPLLILAGENDPRCPIRQIENYIHRLEELGRPPAVYRFDAGHGSLVIEETIRQVEAQIAFAAKHLETREPM